jgi:hypothetical protein
VCNFFSAGRKSALLVVDIVVFFFYFCFSQLFCTPCFICEVEKHVIILLYEESKTVTFCKMGKAVAWCPHRLTETKTVRHESDTVKVQIRTHTHANTDSSRSRRTQLSSPP